MLDIYFSNTPLFLTGVFVFGLLIGSFLNVVILRLPMQLEYDWRCQCRELLDIKDDIEECKKQIHDLDALKICVASHEAALFNQAKR